MRVSGGELLPDTQYLVSVYAYDHGSPGLRTANYVDENNANALVLTSSFVGGTPPQTDDTYKSTGLAMTDANGRLSLRAINTTAGTFGIYLSGFEVSAIPEPTAALSVIGLAGLLMARPRTR